MDTNLKFQNLADFNGGTALAGHFESPFGYENTIARLVTLSGQSDAIQPIDDGVDFEFIGQFKGVTFTVYNYGDERFHIGGDVLNAGRDRRLGQRLDFLGLLTALETALAAVEPSAFEYVTSDGRRVAWEAA